MSKKTQGEAPSEREAFEAWISKSLGHPFKPHLETLAWNSWQARAALASQPQAGDQSVYEKCARVCDALASLYPREDVGFDKGYTMCAKRAADQIRALAAQASQPQAEAVPVCEVCYRENRIATACRCTPPTQASQPQAVGAPSQSQIDSLVNASRQADEGPSDFVRRVWDAARRAGGAE